MRALKWMYHVVLVMLSGVTGSTSAFALTLAAQGTWTSSDGQTSGTWSAIYEVAGMAPDGRITEIGGDITITNMPGLTQGIVQGSLAPGTISFGILYDLQEQGIFTGAVANGGTSLSGTFTRPNDFGGTWQGTMTQGPPGQAPATPTP